MYVSKSERATRKRTCAVGESNEGNIRLHCAAPARTSVRKTDGPFSHASVLDIRPAAEDAGADEVGICCWPGCERQRQPSCFLGVPFDRDIPSVGQSTSVKVFKCVVFLWHLPLPILRLVSGVLSPRLPSLLRPSPVYSLPPSHYVTHSEESSLSSFSSPKNAFKTFSLEAGGGPRPAPPAPLLSARLGRPLLFTSLSRCSDPSSFCSFSDIVRRFT